MDSFSEWTNPNLPTLELLTTAGHQGPCTGLWHGENVQVWHFETRQQAKEKYDELSQALKTLGYARREYHGAEPKGWTKIPTSPEDKYDHRS